MKQKSIREFRRLILLLLTMALLATGCTKSKEVSFEAGDVDFYLWHDPMLIFVKSDVDTFSVSSVEISLSYGLYDEDTEKTPRDLYSFTDSELILAIYFCRWEDRFITSSRREFSDYRNVENHYFLKALCEEEAFSGEYSFDMNVGLRTSYKHHEVVTVPCEIFSREKGDFAIKLVFFHALLPGNSGYIVSEWDFLGLGYEMIGDDTVKILFD